MSENRWERSYSRFSLVSAWQRLNSSPLSRAIDVDLVTYARENGRPLEIIEEKQDCFQPSSLIEQWGPRLGAEPILFVPLCGLPPKELYNVVYDSEGLLTWAKQQTALWKNLRTGEITQLTFLEYEKRNPGHSR